MEPTNEPGLEETRQYFKSRLTAAAEQGRAEGSAAAITAVFRHLGLELPLVVSLPSLREEPISRDTDDLGDYLDPEATARLDLVAALVKDYGPGKEPTFPDTAWADGEDHVHYTMPQSSLDISALDQADSFDV